MRSFLSLLGFLLFTGLWISCGSGGATSPSGGNPTPPPLPPSTGNATNVTIQDFSFSPSSVTIKAGDTVRWTNHGPSDHTTTSDARVWDSGTLRGSGGSFQFVFPQAGTFPYHCTLHPPSLYPNFTGMVTVNP